MRISAFLLMATLAGVVGGTNMAVAREAAVIGWVETYTATCGGKVKSLEVTCLSEGERVTLKFGCGSRASTYTYTCGPNPEGPYVTDLTEETVAEEPVETTSEWFDWQIGATALTLWGGSAPDVRALGGQLSGQLRMSEVVWLIGEFGVGGAHVGGGGDELLTSNEALGVQYRFNQVFALGILGRHHVVFENDVGQGDKLQAAFGELQLVAAPSQNIQAFISGGLGSVWWQEQELATAASTQAPATFRSVDRDEDYVRTLFGGVRASF